MPTGGVLIDTPGIRELHLWDAAGLEDTFEEIGRLAAFGLWWPWGDEITISLRIGLGGYVGELDLVRLRETFDALE